MSKISVGEALRTFFNYEIYISNFSKKGTFKTIVLDKAWCQNLTANALSEIEADQKWFYEYSLEYYIYKQYFLLPWACKESQDQGSSLGLISTHNEAKKVISCNESKSFKMYNEGGNAKQCVTVFINKS